MELHAPRAVPRPQAFVAGLPDTAAFPIDLWRLLTAHRLRTAGRALLGYAPPAGLPALRAALARYLALSRGVACAPEQVMIVNSTMQAVDLAARVLLERGERAWIVMPADLVGAFKAVRSQLDHHSNAMAQAVLADFIEGGHLAAHLRRMRALYRSRRDALLAALSRHGVNKRRVGTTHAGMHVAVHLPRSRSDRAVAERAAPRGVAAMPLSRYALSTHVNGLLLGYAALDEHEIAAAAARLAPLLR